MNNKHLLIRLFKKKALECSKIQSTSYALPVKNNLTLLRLL